tara:strand:- start:13128 stop:14234 length:1107 start_codon:yes stop_codon:yes gene_type:complete
MNNQKDSQLSVCIAGLGFGKSVHLPALKENSSFKDIGAWHPDSMNLDQFCREHKINPYKDWETVLKNKNIDAIIIATPPLPRYKLAVEALTAGKHLLLEKPVAINYQQINDLHRLASNKGLSVAVDFEYRAVPFFMQTKKILLEKQLGDIWFIKFDWLMSSRANKSRTWSWYSNKDEGGGVIGALGTHAVDILHWLIGPTLTVSCNLSIAINERFCEESKSDKKVTSEDICMAQMELRELNGSRIIPAQLNLSSVSMNGRGCWIEIYGSEGTLLLGSDNQKDYVHGFGLWQSENNSQMKRISPDVDFQFLKTWKDGRIAPVCRIQEWWAQSIFNDIPIIPGLLEGSESQKVCDKLKESAISGAKLSVN